MAGSTTLPRKEIPWLDEVERDRDRALSAQELYFQHCLHWAGDGRDVYFENGHVALRRSRLGDDGRQSPCPPDLEEDVE